VEIHQNEKNIGKARMINEAVKRVLHSFVFIVDAETFLEPTFVYQSMRAFHNRRVKGVYEAVLPSDGKTMSEKLGSSSIRFLHPIRPFKRSFMESRFSLAVRLSDRLEDSFLDKSFSSH